MKDGRDKYKGYDGKKNNTICTNKKARAHGGCGIKIRLEQAPCLSILIFFLPSTLGEFWKHLAHLLQKEAVAYVTRQIYHLAVLRSRADSDTWQMKQATHA